MATLPGLDDLLGLFNDVDHIAVFVHDNLDVHRTLLVVTREVEGIFFETVGHFGDIAQQYLATVVSGNNRNGLKIFDFISLL